MRQALSADDHVGKRTGHGQAAIVHGIVQQEAKDARIILMIAESFCLRRLHETTRWEMFGYSFRALSRTVDTFWAVARPREGNPQVIGVAKEEIVKVRKQVGAGNSFTSHCHFWRSSAIRD